MRSRVIANRHLAFAAGAYKNLELQDLEAVSAAIYERDDETLVYGHVGEYLLKVEITPQF
jgi:chaperonin cofactor prefoldin